MEKLKYEDKLFPSTVHYEMEVGIRLLILYSSLPLSNWLIRRTKQDASQLLWTCPPSTSLAIGTATASILWLLWWRKGQVRGILLGSVRKKKGKGLFQGHTYSEDSRPTFISVWEWLLVHKGKYQIPICHLVPISPKHLGRRNWFGSLARNILSFIFPETPSFQRFFF